MDEKKPPASWRLVVAAYAGILLAFVFIRLVIVSSARDPYIWAVELPRSMTFQFSCGLAALACGLAGLFAVGIIADRGTPRQLVVSMLVLPLIFILLEVVNMDT